MEYESTEELVILKDASGNELRLVKADGLYFPKGRTNSFYENTKKLHELNVCEKDIFIIGYAKSGTHWVYEMVGMLLDGTTDTVSKVKEMTMVDCRQLDDVNSLPSPKILNTHYLPRYLPLDILTKCKLIYLLRNPKDIVVSQYNHTHKMGKYAGSFHDYFPFFMESKVAYGSWFDYVRSFEDFFEEHSELNPLIMYYEDINMDPLDAVRKLAKHLCVNYPDEFLEKVAEECHIDKMRVNNETKRHDFTAEHCIDGKSPMYRKGKVGDWKNWFTVAESERLDDLFKEKMKGSRLEFKFDL